MATTYYFPFTFYLYLLQAPESSWEPVLLKTLTDSSIDQVQVWSQDTSTGQLVAQHRTRLGPCGVMAQNSWNGVLGLGHANGSVTMWTPNITTPVVRLLCHRVRNASRCLRFL